jgi:hypothetical protein
MIVNSIQREVMIEQIVESMDGWDSEEVLRWAKDVRRDMLKGVDDETVEGEWYENVGQGLADMDGMGL